MTCTEERDKALIPFSLAELCSASLGAEQAAAIRANAEKATTAEMRVIMRVPSV
jgi:hypothetical protein